MYIHIDRWRPGGSIMVADNFIFPEVDSSMEKMIAFILLESEV